MDAAKAAVTDFMSKAGHHDTTVHETVAPAVVHETVIKKRHEEEQVAIDKEIHQDHYHTSIQPIQDKEILAEKHRHHVAAVETREFDERNTAEIARKLELETAQFKDERVIAGTEHTRSAAPIIAGEHIHHHVHEQIQPVIEKVTIEPVVTHTTIPVHEIHHNAAQHHAVSALPAVSLADFKAQGGVLTGREERFDGFEGEPRNMGTSTTLGGSGTSGSATGTPVTGGSGLGSSSTGTGLTGSGSGSGLTGTGTGSDLTGSRHHHDHHHDGSTPSSATTPSTASKIGAKLGL